MELAIDTSTSQASIALTEQGQMLTEFSWYAGKNHTIELIPNIHYLLEQHQKRPQDLNAIVVAIGPGSFNGLRVGLATAKGLAFSLHIPIVGISTLEALAYQYATLRLPICPILQSGRGEIATAIFAMDENGWNRKIAEHIITIDDLSRLIQETTIICGEIKPEQEYLLREELGEKGIILHGASMIRRASYLAELGWCRIEREDFDDLPSLQPLYLRKPSITRPKRRKHDAMSNMRARAQ